MSRFLPTVPSSYVRKEMLTQGVFLQATHVDLTDATFRDMVLADGGNAWGVTLDCSTWEYGTPKIDILFEVGKQLRPDRMVCPDAFCDSERTLELFREYAPRVGAMTNQVMVVPQGESVAEWVKSCRRLLFAAERFEMTELVIGVPKVLDSYPGGRNAALAWYDTNVLRLSYRPVHLLGVWDSWEHTADTLRRFPWITSVDTTWPFKAAQLGHVLNPSSLGSAESASKEDLALPWELEVQAILDINVAVFRHMTRRIAGGSA